MNDERIVATLRANRGRTAVDLAELLDDLTDGGLNAGSMIVYFKRAFPDIPLRVLQDAGVWRRTCRGEGALSDEQFNDLLRSWLDTGRGGALAPPP